MSKAEYKRLGDYIREVNVRNRELKVTKLVCLTIDKAFIPSVANVIGTDLSNYKVIQKEQFACSCFILVSKSICSSRLWNSMYLLGTRLQAFFSISSSVAE